MELGQGMEQKNIQTLRLSPLQIQNLSVLEMNGQELSIFIENERMENPMLELEDGSSRQSEEAIERMQNNEYEEEDYPIQEEKRENSPYSSISVQNNESLTDYLKSQIYSKDRKKEYCQLLETLIECIDKETGFFSEPINILKKIPGYGEDEIIQAIDTIREMEPVGVGAFDLSDCLLIQVQRQKIEDPLLERIIHSYMKEIAEGKISTISRALHISTEKVRYYIRYIQTLNPRPSKGFGESETIYIIPDIKAVWNHGKWEITICGNTSKDIHLNQLYMNLAKNAKDEEIKIYLEEKIKRAKQMIKAVEQREETLKKVVLYVLIHQERFLIDRGPKQILTMKQIAKELGMHPSTVTRAVKGKYIETPRGVISLKALFPLSKEKRETPEKDKMIVDKIKIWISKEDKKAPLSDQRISERLAEEGIQIARRTVTKYREAYGIKKASERRKN